MEGSDKPPLPFLRSLSVDHIVIIGNYGGGNIGDEAMLAVLIESITELQHDAKIIVPSRSPINLRKLHAHPSLIPVNMTSGSLRALTADILLIGGGSIFFEKNGFGTSVLTIISILRKLLFRKKFYYYGIGVSSKTSRCLRILMTISFRLADGVYVRDSLSNKVVAEDFRVKGVQLMPDLAVFLRRNENLPKEIQELKNRKQGPLVGFSLSTTYSERDGQLFQSIAKFIHYLSEKQNAMIWFLTFYPAFGENDDSIKPDQYAAMSVMNELPPKVKSSVHVLHYYDPATTERIVGELDFMISMRYHGMVFAYKEKKPFIGISSGDKHKSFVNDFGGEELESDSVTFDNLLAKWQKLTNKN